MNKIVKTSLLAIALSVSVNSAFAADDNDKVFSVGKKTYDQACAACHTNGVAGAPKIGNIAAWSARVATGNQALYTSAIRGKGAMPAKGGQVAIPDNNIKAAVDYMVANSSTL